MAAIERKARASVITLSAQGRLPSWREAYAAVSQAVRDASFAAVVFDYDGTLCGASERFTGLLHEVSQQITRLLEAGVSVGIATGRGKSCAVRFAPSRERSDPVEARPGWVS